MHRYQSPRPPPSGSPTRRPGSRRGSWRSSGRGATAAARSNALHQGRDPHERQRSTGSRARSGSSMACTARTPRSRPRSLPAGSGAVGLLALAGDIVRPPEVARAYGERRTRHRARPRRHFAPSRSPSSTRRSCAPSSAPTGGSDRLRAPPRARARLAGLAQVGSRFGSDHSRSEQPELRALSEHRRGRQRRGKKLARIGRWPIPCRQETLGRVPLFTTIGPLCLCQVGKPPRATRVDLTFLARVAHHPGPEEQTVTRRFYLERARGRRRSSKGPPFTARARPVPSRPRSRRTATRFATTRRRLRPSQPSLGAPSARVQAFGESEPSVTPSERRQSSISTVPCCHRCARP